MLVKTLEIGWHEAKPIYSCDFQRRSIRTPSGTVAHKFATAGADTFVRIWLIHPTDPTASGTGDKGPKAEYLSTLAKHTGAVNVVRWNPSGDLLASAADDGLLIIWTRDDKAQGSVWGRDPKEAAHDKETWKQLRTFRVSEKETYDLAWSPTGEYILAGSTDNTARIYSVEGGACVREIADHSHYVQGVAWDPMNEYIATQSSDRSIKLYTITSKHGALETHPVGSHSKMVIRGSRGHSRSNSTASRAGKNNGTHSRAPSVTRPSPSPAINTSTNRGRGHVRRSSVSSEASSVSMAPSYSGRDIRDSISIPTSGTTTAMDAPLTPATSVTSGVGGMFLPPTSTPASARDASVTPVKDPTSYREPRTATTSRRSSFSGSQAPGSPASFRGRGMMDDRDTRSSYGRSPSPMPPLPAIRTPAAASMNLTASRLYGDENFTSFFRRLSFSPDGNLLFTPAGWFEDNSVSVHPGKDEDVALENERKNEAVREATSSSCVYVYSKANFSKSPIAVYPGHRRAVVCVKFSNVLYELRPDINGGGSSTPAPPVTITLEPGKEDVVDTSTLMNAPVTEKIGNLAGASGTSRKELSLPSPALTAADTPLQTPKKLPSATPPLTPALEGAEQGANGATATTSSVFQLPYRMMFAVATHDTVAIHDTQQAGPICILSKLHYDSFTDMAWSHDGHILTLVSSDGYCTVIVFDENMATYSIQQRDLQLKSVTLAHSHSVVNPAVHSTPTHGSTSMLSASSSTPLPASTSGGLGPGSPLVHPPPSPFVPPHAPSPAVSLKELPGPSAHAHGYGGAPSLKRTASTFDPPLTPAASVVGGGDGDTAMSTTGGGNGTESEQERERGDEGPAKKRRRIELQHHGAAV